MATPLSPLPSADPEFQRNGQTQSGTGVLPGRCVWFLPVDVSLVHASEMSLIGQ
jgi:hypothetical protein